MHEGAFAALDEQIEGLLVEEGTPGAAVALTGRDDLLHSARFGLADVSAGLEVAEHTLFEIGSIGKSFTAIALLAEVDAGRLDLHAPVSRYLPWFEIRSDYEPITPHHLLNHTAGIINGRDFTGEAECEVRGLRGRPPASGRLCAATTAPTIRGTPTSGSWRAAASSCSSGDGGRNRLSARPARAAIDWETDPSSWLSTHPSRAPSGACASSGAVTTTALSLHN